MTDGADTFAGLRRRLIELDETNAELARRITRLETENARLSAWLGAIVRVGRRSRRVWNAACDALYSLRWPTGVRPRAAFSPRIPDEESNDEHLTNAQAHRAGDAGGRQG